MFSASVIIAFYNNITALDTILRALENQSNAGFEVVIADDGSCVDVQQWVENRIKESHLDIQHITQEDIGFRKNRILNKAISISRSDYLIFIDGDCIPQKYFVADHLENREPQTILNGRRVDLPSEYKDKLLSAKKPEEFFTCNMVSILFKYLSGKGKNIEKGIRIKSPLLSKFLNRKRRGIVGCNFSLHKEDIISVNGFNNLYEVASIGEDTDIEYRLVKTGKKIKNIFFQANILHLVHPELPRLSRAIELFEETKANNEFIAKNGYNESFQQK
ncbi:glycosyltransferase [Vibrio viridaestus]|uniref:Glycosyltransferase n=1 Tax=Vibrio viridaestus TaxID=2487322 RepID=A0A3N9U1G7_9VIBR|nr:glycosyltransferase [Vibrio viridaestus]RQW61726.1 glycosyltransferase [Vibrio viridaestus]